MAHTLFEAMCDRHYKTIIKKLTNVAVHENSSGISILTLMMYAPTRNTWAANEGGSKQPLHARENLVSNELVPYCNSLASASMS